MTSISVVIPTYNRSRLILEAVASACGQTHPPLEVLIIDDGSTDDTERFCGGLGAPVRYIRQANAGVSAARNRGIQEACGEFVAFLDSDDRWTPEKLEYQLAALQSFPDAEWSFTGVQLMRLDGSIRADLAGYVAALPVFGDTGLDPEALLESRLKRRELGIRGHELCVYVGDAYELFFLGNLAYPSSVLASRRLLLRSAGFDESWRLAEETEFFHRLAAIAPVVVLPQPLLFWRESSPSALTTSTNTVALISQALVSLDRAYALRPTDASRDAVTRAYRRGQGFLWRRLAWARLSESQGTLAREAIRKSWRTGGPSVFLAALAFASLLPRPVLRMLHQLKRRVHRRAG